MNRFLISGLGVALLGTAALAAEPAKGPKPTVAPVKIQVQTVKLGEYWIGIQCQLPTEAVRKKLDLDEGQGLLVADVVPGGPAGAAGIEPQDVILRAGKKPVKSIQDLINAIEAAGGKRLLLQVNRDGKQKQIAVAPEKRPQGAAGKHPMPLPTHPDWQTLNKWMQRMQPGGGLGGPMRFRFFGPGAILPPGASVRPPLPMNLTVAITRSGAEPAKIVVERDKEKWELTENDIDQLPKDIRPHVERMLGRMTGQWFGKPLAPKDLRQFDFAPGAPGWPKPPAMPHMPSLDSLEKQMEKRFEQMNRRFEQLQKSLEEIREHRPKRKAPKRNSNEA